MNLLNLKKKLNSTSFVAELGHTTSHAAQWHTIKNRLCDDKQKRLLLTRRATASM